MIKRYFEPKFLLCQPVSYFFDVIFEEVFLIPGILAQSIIVMAGCPDEWPPGRAQARARWGDRRDRTRPAVSYNIEPWI